MFAAELVSGVSGKDLGNAPFISCHGCTATYCPGDCAGISMATQNAKTEIKKKEWRCKSCRLTRSNSVDRGTKRRLQSPDRDTPISMTALVSLFDTKLAPMLEILTQVKTTIKTHSARLSVLEQENEELRTRNDQLEERLATLERKEEEAASTAADLISSFGESQKNAMRTSSASYAV